MLTTRTRLKVLSEIAKDAAASEPSADNTNTDVDPEQKEKRERRRRKIIDELFESEKTYLHHLNLVHKFFEFPLRFNCLISERAHSELFSNIEQILEVNTKLLEHMEQMTVGTAFKYLGPFLKLYSMYAKGHQQASSTLQDNLQKNEKFAEFIQEQEARPEVGGLKVGALLITPVQRIPRYKLLLEDLLESTSPEHHDYDHIKEAAKQVGEIATHINEHVRQHENFQKMLSIQNSFDSSAPKILAPGREFIKEGKLNKVSRRGGKAQERMFFLFSDMLLYGKPKLLDGGSNSYSCCCVLPLRHCTVEKVLGSRARGGGMFRVTCKEESLLLYCDNPTDTINWIERLENAVRKLTVNRQTLRKPSSNKVPVRGKSLIKMRLRERKTDLKRKLERPNKKGPRSPLKALSEVDVTNCLTPTKRRRTGSVTSESTYPDVAEDGDGRTHVKDYEELNEVNLDEWTPRLSKVPDVEENDENVCDNDSKRCYDIAQEDSDEDSDVDPDLGVIIMDNYSASDKSRGAEGSSSGNGAMQWASSKYSTEEEEGKPTNCSAWTVRRLMHSGTKMTSSIGDAMDSVRNSKRCTLM